MARARTANAALARVFQEANHPVFILDGDRRIVFCNELCAELVGIDASLLVGQTCDYTSPTGLETGAREAALLCPPPSVFAGGRYQGQVSTRQNGALTSHAAEFFGLLNDDGDLSGVLTILLLEDRTYASDPLLPDTHEAIHRRILAQQNFHQGVPRQMAGDSPLAARLRDQVTAAASGDAPLTVSGVDGSGRLSLAQHIYSLRQATPWLVPVDCAITDPELLQNTLTSVFAQRPQHDANPTLLLRQVDQLPAATQQELAGFLRLPTFHVATIATSSQKLSFVESFDPDLAVLLTALEIELPSLMQRAGDIPLLAQAKLESLNKDSDRQLAGFTDASMDQLVAYHWPGEIEELERVVEQAYAVAEGVQIELSDLPGVLRHAAVARQLQPPRDKVIHLDEFLAGIERELIERALASEDNNKSAAAKKLGVSRARLLRRISQLFDD